MRHWRAARPGTAAPPATADPAAKHVFLHIGAPKTGTTFLQQVLWANREALAETGVCYPLSRPREHFHATMDLRQMTWGGKHDPAWDGAWDRVSERVRAWPGRAAVLSNELLGAATPDQIARAVRSLGPGELHIVFTARDFARQLPSDWQEQVKHTHSVTYPEFLEVLVNRADGARPHYYEMFWGLHDPVRVLAPWADAVGPGHVHVVTVPQAGASRDVLWRRFAALVGIAADSCDLAQGRSNESLGSVEAELLRRTNERADRVQPRVYDQKLRSYLVGTVLAGRPNRAAIPLPAEFGAWANERSEKLIAELQATGYHIVGDLEELRPAPASAGTRRDPTAISDGELLDAALDALAGLLTRPTAAPKTAPNRGST